MTNQTNELLYDIRCVERHIRQGKVKRSDVDTYLATIPDSSANAEMVTVATGASTVRGAFNAELEAQNR